MERGAGPPVGNVVDVKSPVTSLPPGHFTSTNGLPLMGVKCLNEKTYSNHETQGGGGDASLLQDARPVRLPPSQVQG